MAKSNRKTIEVCWTHKPVYWSGRKKSKPQSGLTKHFLSIVWYRYSRVIGEQPMVAESNVERNDRYTNC